MSVVAARVYKDCIGIAADSIVVRGWSKRTGHHKLFKENGVIIGGSGHAAENELMHLFIRTHKPSGNTEKDIIDFIQEFLAWKKNKINDGSSNNNYLMVYDGHLFHIERDGLVYEIHENDFSAVGAGEDFALAAMYCDKNPTEAVKIACELSCMVAEPIMEYWEHR